MYDSIPVKIENRELPEDTMYKRNNSSSGFTDVIFLSSMIATSILWIIIITIIK